MSHRNEYEPSWKPARRKRPEHLESHAPEPTERRKALNRIFGIRDDGLTSQFVKTPHLLDYGLPLDLAYFLGILMDWDRRKSLAKNGGWFYFPTKWIAANFPHATPKVQRRLFRELRTRAYIKTKMKHGDGKTRRWIWIDCVRIEKECREARSR